MIYILKVKTVINVMYVELKELVLNIMSLLILDVVLMFIVMMNVNKIQKNVLYFLHMKNVNGVVKLVKNLVKFFMNLFKEEILMKMVWLLFIIVWMIWPEKDKLLKLNVLRMVWKKVSLNLLKKLKMLLPISENNIKMVRLKI